MKDNYLFDEPLEIEFSYTVTFGCGDGSECMDWYETATPEEEKALYEAYTEGVDIEDVLDEYPVLYDVYNRASNGIEKQETENALEMESEYAQECEEEGCSPYDEGWTIELQFCDYESFISMENALKYADKHDKHYFFNEHCYEVYDFSEEVDVEYCFEVDNPWYETDTETACIPVTKEEAELYKKGMKDEVEIDEIEGLHDMLRRARHQIFCDAEFDPEEQPNVTLNITFPEVDDSEELEENLQHIINEKKKKCADFKDEDYLFGKPLDIDFCYTATFGTGDGTEELYWTLKATPDEEKALYEAYTENLEDELTENELFEKYPVLEEAYDRASSEIEIEELENGLSWDDEFVKDCIRNKESPYDVGWSLNVHFSPFEKFIRMEDALKYADKFNKTDFYEKNSKRFLK